MNTPLNKTDYKNLAESIKDWGLELGFQQVGITDTDLAKDEKYLLKWLDQAMHGEMNYMQRHGNKRTRPAELIPGTIRIISVRMDYLPGQGEDPESILNNPEQAYVSRYATGRDYHKIIRNRLQKLAEKISNIAGEYDYRAFTDSAPVLEKAIARNSGLGWIGKHTNLINPTAGSWFFLGEIYTDLPLPVDDPFITDHCGSCTACIDVCPTQAIVEPYKVDARRCISYLTIELRESIPEEFRKELGNRIYGCDDCQLVCPWNKFTQHTPEKDFTIRNSLDSSTLIDLFNWTEEDFMKKTEGSAIRRIGYEAWLRNIAVALGNLLANLVGNLTKDMLVGNKKSQENIYEEVINVLEEKKSHPSIIVREHVEWALLQRA
ncbi:MAG: tRNA epoxyqueuosine(34) reductase QueG [Gammaproteobacteria bacterium]|nr:tRNA epoxyqueuosine(34) reductase QueG [Gammaproteobacteria bacterium]